MSRDETIRDPFLEWIEAYALGSLDPEEHTSLAAHLAGGCQDCAKALAEARWVVSQLAYLAPEAQPPGPLRRRLAETVRREAGRERPVSGKPIPFWLWGAVAAAVLFALYNLREAQSLRETVRRTEAALDEQLELQKKSAGELALARREAWILSDPKSLKIEMPARQKGVPDLKATWHRALGILISGEKLPVPDGKRTLQLWLIPKAASAQPIPSLTVRPDRNGTLHLLVENPPDGQAGTRALAITEEPEGGSPQPTTAPLWVGALAGK